MPALSLEEKVAQLFMVGSDSVDLAEEIEPFYRYGLGGVLLFRHHLQPFSEALDLRDFLKHLPNRFKGAGVAFIGIDQEGGQVERLPHWLFPTGILPVVYGLRGDRALCEQVNREVARRMRWLGINLNFTPTVDLNRELMNPIIGVRAYGESAEAVLPYARQVIQAHLEAGVLPVAKHFPGHGSGTVDSHLDLPIFESWTEEELRPYEALRQENLLPAVLIAHGLYPKLARLLGSDYRVPASLSPDITTGLLREEMGFNGLVFTDDLMMGAVWGDADPVEVAIKALQAGADQLVYRRAQPEAIHAFEAIVSLVQRGKIAEAMIDDKVQRILETKARLSAVEPYDYPAISVSEEACQALSLQWAQQALTERHHQFRSPLPFAHTTRWGLVAPDRSSMRHYKPDAARGKDLLEWCVYYGIKPQVSHFYRVEGEVSPMASSWPDLPLEVLVFIAFNAHLNPQQVRDYEALKAQHPEAKMILASCGMPTDGEFMSRPWIQVQLPSFRPAAMQAFVQWLITSPQGSV